MIARQTAGLTGADLANIATRRRSSPAARPQYIAQADFEAAMERSSPGCRSGAS
jgi:ATP-dependent Zn protease